MGFHADEQNVICHKDIITIRNIIKNHDKKLQKLELKKQFRLEKVSHDREI
jgi:hypothetical protein